MQTNKSPGQDNFSSELFSDFSELGSFLLNGLFYVFIDSSIGDPGARLSFVPFPERITYVSPNCTLTRPLDSSLTSYTTHRPEQSLALVMQGFKLSYWATNGYHTILPVTTSQQYLPKNSFRLCAAFINFCLCGQELVWVRNMSSTYTILLTLSLLLSFSC